MNIEFASAGYTAGQLNAIIKLLKKQGGEDAPERFLRGELNVSAAAPREFAVWQSIKLGTCKTPDEYRKALKKAGQRISDWGDDIVGKTNCSQEETEVHLVVLSVKELGFDNRAQYKDICAKAVELGLELCPDEVGPALRLAYGDQPSHEWLRIATETITGSVDRRRIFAVGHGNDKLWLNGDSGDPENFWSVDSRFVFLRRKS